MLKHETIKIYTKGFKKLDLLESFGYDVSGESVIIKIEHLNVGSRMIVEYICDYCGKEGSIVYKNYLRNISNNGKFGCSKYCGSLKAKETCMEKYGVISAMSLKEIQDKTKKTNKERYGVEYLQQSNDIREKTKKNLIEKYGVDHNSKTDEFLLKFKKTCMERYGVEYPLLSEEIQKKSKSTLMNNYGVDNPSKSSDILNKKKIGNIEKYGVEYPAQSEEVIEKMRITCIEKYGVDNINKHENFRLDNFKIANDVNYIKYLSDGNSLFKCDYGKPHEFIISSDIYSHRIIDNIKLCTVCGPVSNKVSIKEIMLRDIVSDIYKGDIISSYKDKFEIDIYLPDLKIGFEFNGLYYHSNKFRSNKYHIDKTNYFKEKGIRVIHIWEDIFDFKLEILKSQIRNWTLNTPRRIFARDCIVKEIDQSKEFLDENHIQGGVSSTLKLGLFLGDELLSVMTFDQVEGRKKMPKDNWNLNRFCNKINTTVVGGASKLLSYFIKYKSPIRIISYSDNDWSDGGIYYSLNFEKISEANPDYKYIIDGKRINKSRFRKSRLNTNLSESEYMKSIGIYKVYDCGKTKFQIVL